MHPIDGTDDGFGRSRARFEELVGFLEQGQAARLDHGQLEDRLAADGQELLRLLYQDHLDLRAAREPRLEQVLGADGVSRGSVEAGHERILATVFGPVTATRIAYRHRGHANLHPADAVLNLPVEKHSHGLRRLAAIESARGSFEQAAAALTRATGQRIGKRQVEALTARAAADVHDFYATRPREEQLEADVLVISADGKGIVMRPDALRPATARAAATASPKLATRLSKGEKRNRKRMAEVGAVYDLTPVPRSAADVFGDHARDKPDPDPVAPPVPPPPRAKNKWVTASVVDQAATVITTVFDQAERRNPHHSRAWVALVDGNNHQVRHEVACCKWITRMEDLMVT